MPKIRKSTIKIFTLVHLIPQLIYPLVTVFLVEMNSHESWFLTLMSVNNINLNFDS